MIMKSSAVMQLRAERRTAEPRLNLRYSQLTALLHGCAYVSEAESSGKRIVKGMDKVCRGGFWLSCSRI
jgi:hypothetical protein